MSKENVGEKLPRHIFGIVAIKCECGNEITTPKELLDGDIITCLNCRREYAFENNLDDLRLLGFSCGGCHRTFKEEEITKLEQIGQFGAIYCRDCLTKQLAWHEAAIKQREMEIEDYKVRIERYKELLENGN